MNLAFVHAHFLYEGFLQEGLYLGKEGEDRCIERDCALGIDDLGGKLMHGEFRPVRGVDGGQHFLRYVNHHGPCRTFRGLDAIYAFYVDETRTDREVDRSELLSHRSTYYLGSQPDNDRHQHCDSCDKAKEPCEADLPRFAMLPDENAR